MPYYGLIPFLLRYVCGEKKQQKMFQCPTTGSSHFYGIPSQTPIKPAFPGTISGGISQNILKIKVLPTKNGMFTICSYFTCFYSTIIPIFMQAVISFLKHIENKKICISQSTSAGSAYFYKRFIFQGQYPQCF